jgi:hypothetical protein
MHRALLLVSRQGETCHHNQLLTVQGTSASASSDENLALASTELRRLACSLQFRWCCRMMSRSGPRITLYSCHGCTAVSNLRKDAHWYQTHHEYAMPTAGSVAQQTCANEMPAGHWTA